MIEGKKKEMCHRRIRARILVRTTWMRAGRRRAAGQRNMARAAVETIGQRAGRLLFKAVISTQTRLPLVQKR